MNRRSPTRGTDFACWADPGNPRLMLVCVQRKQNPDHLGEHPPTLIVLTQDPPPSPTFPGVLDGFTTAALASARLVAPLRSKSYPPQIPRSQIYRASLMESAYFAASAYEVWVKSTWVVTAAPAGSDGAAPRQSTHPRHRNARRSPMRMPSSRQEPRILRKPASPAVRLPRARERMLRDQFVGTLPAPANRHSQQYRLGESR